MTRTFRLYRLEAISFHRNVHFFLSLLTLEISAIECRTFARGRLLWMTSQMAGMLRCHFNWLRQASWIELLESCRGNWTFKLLIKVDFVWNRNAKRVYISNSTHTLHSQHQKSHKDPQPYSKYTKSFWIIVPSARGEVRICACSCTFLSFLSNFKSVKTYCDFHPQKHSIYPCYNLRNSTSLFIALPTNFLVLSQTLSTLFYLLPSTAASYIRFILVGSQRWKLTAAVKSEEFKIARYWKRNAQEGSWMEMKWKTLFRIQCGTSFR